MPACSCSEARRPFASDLPAGSNVRPRQWFVWRRNWSASAFNGYRPQWSAYSLVHCRCCGALWSTRAGYVPRLRDCEYAGTGKHPPTVAPIE